MKEKNIVIYICILFVIVAFNVIYINELKFDLIFIDLFLSMFFWHILRSEKLATAKTGIYIGILNYFVLGLYVSHILTKQYSESSSRQIVLVSLLLFFVLFEITYRITRTKDNISQKEFDFERLYFFCNIALWCIIILNLYITITSYGSISNALTKSYSEKAYKQSNYILYTYHIMFPAFLYLYIYTRIIKKRKINIYIYICMFVSMFILLLMKSRGNVVEFACSIILVEILRSSRLKKNIKKIRLFLSAVLIAIIVIAIGITRDNNQGQSLTLEDSIVQNIKGSADDIDVFYYIVELHPDRYAYFYGKTFLGGVFSFVPRKVWVDKPISYGNQIMIYKYGNILENYAVAPSYPGECYANLGIIGVCLGGILIGIITKRIDLMRKTPINMVVLIISMFTMWRLMRGDFQNVYIPYIIKLAFVLAMLFVGKIKTRNNIYERKN